MVAPVLVVGAGPAGLMLAGELRLAGVEVVVLERNAAPTGESRGIGLSVRTMEILNQRGLLSSFGDVDLTTTGHFGGVPLNFEALGPGHASARSVPQSQTEEVLERWATRLGADIRRGVEVEALFEDPDGVTVETRSGERYRSCWLVGCDGGRSTVRKLAGFDFPGTEAQFELLLADVRGLDLDPKLSNLSVPGGMTMVGRLPGGIHRIIVGVRDSPPRPRSGPPDFAEVADLWKRLTDGDISGAEPLWVSAFGDGARQVTEYRRGRTLLAGDAAHVHMPAGGQGMNTSIQDAVNLGWKLASIIRGFSDESLLDSYHTERHPVGERLLTNTRAQTALIMGGDEVAPLRDLLSELAKIPEVQRHLAAKAAGVEVRYDLGSGTHPLLGARMPEIWLTVGNRCVSSAHLLRSGRGLLLDLTDNARLRDRAVGWRDRLDVTTASPSAPLHDGLTDTTAILLRPDGHVAWAAPGCHHDLPSALQRWFGPDYRSRKER